jgi:hypothetical protein
LVLGIGLGVVILLNGLEKFHVLRMGSWFFEIGFGFWGKEFSAPDSRFCTFGILGHESWDRIECIGHGRGMVNGKPFLGNNILMYMYAVNVCEFQQVQVLPGKDRLASSNRSGDGGNEAVGAFDGKGRFAIPRRCRP